MKKTMFATLVLTLVAGSLAMAEEGPKNLQCDVQEISDYQSHIETVVQQKTLRPKIKYTDLVGGEVTLVQRKDFKVTLEVSFLRYHPLVTTYVTSGAVHVETGLTANVADPQTGNRILVNCSYDQ